VFEHLIMLVILNRLMYEVFGIGIYMLQVQHIELKSIQSINQFQLQLNVYVILKHMEIHLNQLHVHYNFLKLMNITMNMFTNIDENHKNKLFIHSFIDSLTFLSFLFFSIKEEK